MTHIPENFIADLIARTDIVEVVDHYVPLRKSGSNFVACCPFHGEKTPSFTVSPTKQFYYCFGCGAHGNVIGFLMKHNHSEFIDAVENLASRLGLEIPVEQNNESKSLQGMFQLLGRISEYYQQELRKSPKALAYLKSRGLTGNIIRSFHVGYAPAMRNHLLNLIGNDIQDATASGMLINQDARFYNRIMFPIHDYRGRVIGFGGRVLDDSKPKYLNSPETPIFHKGQELYGLYEAKLANPGLPYIIIVEGYMDVIALAQHGYTCTVATLGTATTVKHLQKLLRVTNKIIFCFDGDEAGKKAGWRALENILPIVNDGVEIAFIFLPGDEDPDSQVRKEGTAFIKRITDAMPLSDFFFHELSKDMNLQTIDGKAHFAKKAKNLIDKMPNSTFQQLMLARLTSMIGVAVDKPKEANFTKVSVAEPTRHYLGFENLVYSAIALLLQNPVLAKEVDINPLTDVNESDIILLIKLVFHLQQNPDHTLGIILSTWSEPKETELFAKLAAKEILTPYSGLKNELHGIINRLIEYSHQLAIKKLLDKASKEEITLEEKYTLQKLILGAKIKDQPKKSESNNE